MNKICILPWIHIEADSNGNAKPCCLYRESIGDFNHQSLKEVWNSKKITNLRNEFLEGKQPSGCQQCWDEEEAGKQSKRQVELERFSHLSNRINNLSYPAYLDLKLGRVCNLKCRTCNSFSSSKWIKDEKKLYGSAISDNELGYWISDDMPIWNELLEIIPDLEFIDFSGGEPLLIKRHFDFLQEIIDQGYSKNIGLHYNTNGTVMPTDKMLNIWKEFKYVEIMLSADGIGKHFEYLRHPGKWNDFVKVFNTFQTQSNLHVTICCSISVMNIYYLDDFISWCESKGMEEHDLYLNLIHNPSHFCITSLPSDIKSIITKKITHSAALSIINFMNSHKTENLVNFFKVTDALDKIRKEKFSDTFPEFFHLIRNY